MDFDSSSKFIASLAKFLQSLCNGYVDFDKGVEVIGHIYINVDSDTGKKVDYVLNEKVCKNDNSITFISNSFHAQPAEKPKPIPKKAPELEKPNEDTIVMEDSGPTVPSSTNVGTLGSFRNTQRAGSQDISFTPGSKRPRTPPNRRNQVKSGSSPAAKHMSPSSRYQDSGGPSSKISRTDIPPSPLNSGVSGEDYENQNVFQSGGEEDDSENFSSNFLDEHNSTDIDQKPIIDPDISIVKEEYMSNQQNSCAFAGTNQSSGPGRGKNQQSAYPVLMHPNSSGYSGPTAPSTHQTDSYSSSVLDSGGDPSKHSEECQLNWLPFKGDIKKTCSSSSRGSAKLSRVVHKDGSVRYMCDRCEKQYRHYRDLIRHRYQCLQKRLIVCGECSKTFFRSDALANHLRHCHRGSCA